MQTNTSRSHQPLHWCQEDVSHGMVWWGWELSRQLPSLKKTYCEVGKSKPLEDTRKSQFAQIIVIIVSIHDEAKKDQSQRSANNSTNEFLARD